MKQKTSERMKELWKTDEYRNKILNILHSDDYKKRQSEIAKKLWQDEEIREKIITKLKGQKRSEETKKKLSEQKIGDKNPMKNKIFSEEEIEYRRNNNPFNKKVKCLETEIIYKSCAECGRKMNLDNSSISKVCMGELKHFHNYHFIYIEKERE